MAKAPRVDSPKEVGARLRLIRIAYGRAQKYTRELSQSEMARQAKIGIQAWNNAETGDNRIGLDNALALSELTGVSLDYIFRGHRGLLPHAIAVEIDKIEAEGSLRLRA